MNWIGGEGGVGIYIIVGELFWFKEFIYIFLEDFSYEDFVVFCLKIYWVLVILEVEYRLENRKIGF